MTRRERKQQRLEKRLEWAESRDKQAAAGFESARRIADAIPFGQPILVGHHSERHARRDQERIESGMSKGGESTKMADHHRATADGIARQLETSVFSDDPDAVEALEARALANEARREQMKTVNRLYKKGDAEGLKALGLDLEKLRAGVAASAFSWVKLPHAPYEFTNLGARIRADRERIKALQARQAHAEKAEKAGGVLIERHAYASGDYAVVTFAEKPDREILNALRVAGFHWGNGHWSGKAEALPQIVSDLVSREERPTC